MKKFVMFGLVALIGSAGCLSAESITLSLSDTGTLSFNGATLTGAGLQLTNSPGCAGCSVTQAAALAAIAFPLSFGYTSGTVTGAAIASGGSVAGLDALASGIALLGGTFTNSSISGPPVINSYSVNENISASSLLGEAGDYMGVLSISNTNLPSVPFNVTSGVFTLTLSSVTVPEPSTSLLLGVAAVAGLSLLKRLNAGV